MPQTLKIFSSTALEEDEQLASLLSRLEDVEIIEVPEARLLADRVPLPFVETTDGWRYVGIDAIEQFVADYAGGRLQ